MSTYLLSYREGTLSVANGSTSVTGTLTVWTTNVQPGDLLVIGTTWAEVASIQSNTALTLVSAWSGTTATGSAYIIHRFSKGWSAAGTTALLLSLYESNRPSFIPTTGAPSNSIGADGNIAVDWTAGLMYRKEAGAWGSGLAFRTRPSGAYSGATAYAAGDIVTNQSASWIARVATTGVAPPTLPTETNTQWQLIGKSGDLTRLDAVAAGDLAAWTGTNSAQVRKATAAEVRTAAGGIREVLAANRTYYVATTGSNANNGLSAGAPFLTLQYAVDVAAALDPSIYTVTIQLADGTYTENVVFKLLVSGRVVVQGNAANPQNVIVATTGAYQGAFTASSGVVGYTVKDLTVQGPGSITNYGFRNLGGEISFTNIRFGSGLFYGIYGEGATYTMTGNCSLVASVTNSLIYMTALSRLAMTNRTWTFTGTPSVGSAGFVVCDQSRVNGWSMTFTGSVTGKQYSVINNGVLATIGQYTSYPGPTTGTTATGGQVS